MAKNQIHKAWRAPAKPVVPNPQDECAHSYGIQEGYLFNEPLETSLEAMLTTDFTPFNFCPWCSKDLRKEKANGNT